jgi:hypothetical protein
VFERPDYAVLGQTRYDQNWIDSNTEAGVAACGWQRPEPRPPALKEPSRFRHLTPPKKKRPGLIRRIKRAVAPNANAQSRPPAAPPAQEAPSIPAAPAELRDPVDELLEPDEAPPLALPSRRCWWC